MSQYVTVEDARALIRERLPKERPSKRVPLAQALGLSLKDTIYTEDDIPPFSRSAMDGYALRSGDTPGTLRVMGTSYAGSQWWTPLQKGESVRVMTGAPIPPGADTVIEQERVELRLNTIRLHDTVKPQRNIMTRGHEYPKGSMVLQSGTRLTPINIGQLASLGLTEVSIVQPPTVLILTTGDELQDESPLLPGKIHNTNGPLLEALCAGFQAQIFRSHLADDPDIIKEALKNAQNQYDLILTTGGVSVGERDFLPPLLHENFDRLFWRVDMHPGKAMAAAMIGDTPLLALSGNPGAMLTSWFVIVAPIMATLCQSSFTLKQVQGRLAAPYPKPTREKRFLKARFQYHPSGLVFDIIDNQSSDALTSFAEADGLVMIENGSPPQDEGTVLHGFWLPSF